MLPREKGGVVDPELKVRRLETKFAVRYQPISPGLRNREFARNRSFNRAASFCGSFPM